MPEQVKAREQVLTAADLVERLLTFDGPPQEFLRYLLAVQCRLAAAESGAMLRPGTQGDVQVLTMFPQPEKEGEFPPWVQQAGEATVRVLGTGKTEIFPLHDASDLYGEDARRYLIMLPIKYTGRADVRGASAFLVETRDPRHLRGAQERLELSLPLLSLYEMQLMLTHRQADMRRLRDALEVVSAMNRHDRFTAATLTVCNEFAARWGASRVSLGYLQGKSVRLRSISHTENFSKKMQLVQDIEQAQEECLDQDVEILFPASTEATYVSRAAGRLSERHGPSAICSLPLRHGDDVKAVLTIERPREKEFQPEEIESMRLAADLATARLINLHEQDRWIGGKVAFSIRKGAGQLVGPKHTWAKLLAIGILFLGIFLIFAKGDYTVESPFVLEDKAEYRVPAPFEGQLEEVMVEPPDVVKAGQPLARLATDELQDQLDSAEAELVTKEKAKAQSQSEGKLAEAQIAEAQAAQARAKIDLYKGRLERAVLRSPIDGVVIAGDWKRQNRPPVKLGDPVFEIGSTGKLRAELAVDEKDIHELHVNQEGKLATVGRPEEKVGFKVETIAGAAESSNGKNIFKVRVDLDKAPAGMRPGMAGVAHVSVERRRYAWIWTHKAIDWVRLKLWI